MHIGVDLGMGALKLYANNGHLQLPAQVALDGGRVVSRQAGFRQGEPPLRVEIGGNPFFVGGNAHQWGRPVENLDYERLTGSPEILAIFYASLSRLIQQAGPLRQPLSLIVGLPLEPLSAEEEVVEETVQAVRRWLRGSHSWCCDGQPYHVTVAHVRIASQPAGALFDYLLDENGRFLPQRKAQGQQELGVMSLGFNTVELMVIQNREIINRFTAGSTHGVRRLLELVGGASHYSLGELDSQLRAGSLAYKAALPIWSREVLGEVEKRWGSQWRRFRQIIVVGGGALLLEQELKTALRGKVHLPQQPVFSIARGLHKLGQMRGGRR